MGFDAIPEDRERSFPCEVCNGSIKLSAVSGLWECDECGCLPGSKLVAGYTKEEHEEAAGMGLEDAFMSHHEQPCDCAICDDIAFWRSLRGKPYLEPAAMELLRQKVAKFEKALEQIASQPLEPAHIYEIADRIKLIAKVALEI